MASKGGRVVLGEKESVPLAVNADGTLSANFTASHDGFYRIELDAPNGERLTASPQYTVDLLSDLAPTVKLSKPGRDTDATPVEEFFVEARADDDYAVKNLQLVYQINGGAEKVIPLFGGAQADQRSHRRAHLLHGGARREGRRLGVVLRARHRQRRDQRRQADEQRHLFPAHPSVRQELQAGGVDVAAAAVAAVAAARKSARCRSSSARSFPAPSTSSAIARP